MMKLWIVCVVAIAALFSSTSGRQLQCDGPHEEFACGSACQTTCDNLGKPCPYVNIRCNEDCYCEPGYARDCRNVCIPVSSCPGTGCRRSLPFRKQPGISRF